VEVQLPKIRREYEMEEEVDFYPVQSVEVLKRIEVLNGMSIQAKIKGQISENSPAMTSEPLKPGT
jgi:tetrahydromethanopterin S-methyltransferase subunit A